MVCAWASMAATVCCIRRNNLWLRLPKKRVSTVAKALMNSYPLSRKKEMGLTGLSLNRTSKWTCGPVERPVEPARATT